MFIGLRNCDSDSFGLAQINEAKKVGVDLDKSFASSLKGPYNKIMLHWDGLKIFIKLKQYTKVILN